MVNDYFEKNVFSRDFLEYLSHLKLLLKKNLYGKREGHVSSPKTGSSVDFLGHRSYSWGDEIKHLDWNLYARTGEAFIKEFAREQNKSIVILLDSSASMTTGTPSKFVLARQLAAALAYIATCSGHMAQIGFIKENKIHYSSYFHSPQQLFDLLHFLSQYSASGILHMKQALGNFSRKHSPTSVFIASDLLAIGDIGLALKSLVTKGYQLSIFHLLATEEYSPKFKGHISLKDIETNKNIDIVIDAEKLELYRQGVKKFQNKWQSFCKCHYISYHFETTATSIEKIVHAVI